MLPPTKAGGVHQFLRLSRIGGMDADKPVLTGNVGKGHWLEPIETEPCLKRRFILGFEFGKANCRIYKSSPWQTVPGFLHLQAPGLAGGFRTSNFTVGGNHCEQRTSKSDY